MADYLIDLDSDEQIILEVRKHIFVFLLEVLLLGVFLLLPLFVASPLVVFLSEATGRGNTLFLIFYLLWLLILWIAFFFRWTDYYLDVWVVTNKRLFDIDQNGMFSRSTSVLRLERIEDVTVDVRGILPTLLKYGNIHVHTAGSHDTGSGKRSDITIEGAHHPLEVKRVIMEEYGKCVQGSARPRDKTAR